MGVKELKQKVRSRGLSGVATSNGGGGEKFPSRLTVKLSANNTTDYNVLIIPPAEKVFGGVSEK